MTWDELKEKAKEMGYTVVIKYPRDKKCECITNGYYGFYYDGVIECDCSDDDKYRGYPFVYGISFDKMWKIMDALQ